MGGRSRTAQRRSTLPELREIFNEDPELYDRVRPGYPDELFDDLVRLGGLTAGSRVLEIGPGTGQATAQLLERGLRVTGIELGAGLAAVARRRLERFGSRLEIVRARFEDWPLPRQEFDAVVAFTSFHWLDPDVRIHRAADALRPGAVLATVATHHVAGGDAAFFREVQRCYLRWDPDTTEEEALPRPEEVSFDAQEIERTGRFGAVTFRRYAWEQPYSTEEYLDVLRSYSGHRALGDRLPLLLACIRDLIDREFDGRIRKRYLNELRLAPLTSAEAGTPERA